MSKDLDEFLAECDDVIDDWEGSADSATWTADESHEGHDHFTQHLYLEVDLVRLTAALRPAFAAFTQMAEAYRAVDFTGVTRAVRTAGRVHDDYERGALAAFERHHLNEWVRANPSMLAPPSHPLSGEALALLDPSPLDPMRPPAYLWRPRINA